MRTNVLISSAGRRVGLVEAFRESLRALGISGRIIAVDATQHAAAGEVADAFYVVPRCDDPNFLPCVLDICELEKVHLVVPTIDTELRHYAAARDNFHSAGVRIAISHLDAITICEDKVLTHRWLVANGFPTPRQSVPASVLENPGGWTFPVAVKPRNGSASCGFRVINSADELGSTGYDGSIILQEFIDGKEFTVNGFVDRHGKCLCAIPHHRMEIRGGEVSKGVTTRHEGIIQVVSQILESLPGAYGAMNVQCFLTPAGEIRVIEINARFGGGYPLAHHAGATISRWLIEDSLGMEPTGPFENWEDGMVMLRYDQAVFVPKGRSRALATSHAQSLHSL